MSAVKILDCTLRDGGYCNQWDFGEHNISKIVKGLDEAGIDIIECGFLTNRVRYHPDVTRFDSIDRFKKFIPEVKNGKTYVAMLNYGEYRLEDIPACDKTSLDGLRVAFHKKDRIEALKLCEGLQDKGYKVFIQAMVTLSYTDKEFLDLISRVNKFKPDSFYIVDSFGAMKRKDLIRLFYMVENNLQNEIAIGYHSHNNMQLSYSNAQTLADIRTAHDMIFDSSIFGMGRGAGNLNTELFVEYLNEDLGKEYILKPLLTIIDETLDNFYQQNHWGYSLPNYLSAKHNAHPNYAGYLDSKKTLTVEDMDEIFSMMDDEKKCGYDQAYAEDLYVKYMTKGKTQEEHFSEFRDRVYGKEILMIAPGKSSQEEKECILAKAKEDEIITIAVNFEYSEYKTDYVFISNLRRYREMDMKRKERCIVTSNIPASDVYLQADYSSLTNEMDMVGDNASLMLINFLIRSGVKKIWMAGLDGYSIDPEENFANPEMNFFAKKVSFEALNQGMNTVLKQYRREISIEFVTTPRYLSI